MIVILKEWEAQRGSHGKRSTITSEVIAISTP